MYKCAVFDKNQHIITKFLSQIHSSKISFKKGGSEWGALTGKMADWWGFPPINQSINQSITNLSRHTSRPNQRPLEPSLLATSPLAVVGPSQKVTKHNFGHSRSSSHIAAASRWLRRPTTNKVWLAYQAPAITMSNTCTVCQYQRRIRQTNEQTRGQTDRQTDKDTELYVSSSDVMS